MAAPDIFLSYNREDSGRAKLFAEAFAAEGFEVWWDVALRSGEAYDEVTEAALGNARAVVVLWSPRSVVSRWVRAEATEAERNKTLLPVMIEPCKRPIMFELVQTAELSHWQGDTADAAWQAFLSDVRNFLGAPPAPAPAAAPEAPARANAGLSVVVLPFANMSNDPEQDYFADGISEDIITDLSKVSALLVIARNTAFTFKGKHVDVKDVARQLGVSHVLEGSVRKAGNRVRVTAQLIDGTTGGHVWADRYDRELDDIFALQDELSEAIVAALKVTLLPAEKQAIENRGTRNAQAYDCYIRARSLRASMQIKNVHRAVGEYRKAIELDPEFALAWAGLASGLLQIVGLSNEVPDSAHEEIAAAQARASELAPDSPNIVAGRAGHCMSIRDWPGAEECVAWLADHNDASWSVCSHILQTLGRPGLAAEHQFKVWRSDPFSLGAAWALQYHLDCAGRSAEARDILAEGIALHGPNSALLWLDTLRSMAAGEHARVRERFAEVLTKDVDRQPFGDVLLAAIDQPDEARAIVRAAAPAAAAAGGLQTNSIAHWAAYLGDGELAIDMLLHDAGRVGFMIMDIWHPNFAAERRNPRFKQVLEAARLPEHWRRTGNWGDFARPLGDDDFELIA
jgi:adenylate cyclase